MKADLEAMTVPQLKDLAKTAGIHKYGGMNKTELIAALEKPIESMQAGVDEKPAESSSKESDLAKHPKFDKFK